MKTLIHFALSLLAGLCNLAWAFCYANSGIQNMAKVKLSALVSEMRGKLNGSVFSRNRGGAYLRTKVTPSNPQTPSQLAARSLLASLSQAWRSLTVAQRTAWNAVVENFPSVDVFGDQRIPSGQQLFIRLNTNITNVGAATINDPPAPVGAEETGALTLTVAETADVFTVAYVNTPVPADHAMLLEATAGKSAGIDNFTSFFRVISTVAAAQVSPELASVDYVTKFGSIVEGLKYGTRAKYIRLTTGEVSVPETTNAIAAA